MITIVNHTRVVRGLGNAVVLALCIVVVARAVAIADTTDAEQAVTAGTPEPFKATSHRRFDDVEHWQEVFDDPARDEWQKPDLVVAALAIPPGTTVVDLGAGTGYFSARLAAAVGRRGAVLAVEVEPNLVAHLRARAEHEKTANLTPILGSHDNPRVPAAAADLIVLVDTVHHIDDRRGYFERLAASLRPHARIAIIDWKKEESTVGPPLGHRLAREQVVSEMEASGYLLIEEPKGLPYQYFLIFSRR